MASATRILERCDALARCSEQAEGLTRVYLSPRQRSANAPALQWHRATEVVALALLELLTGQT